MGNVFIYDKEFALECGEILPSLKVAYHTFGRLNNDRSNVAWVCHALTANSDVADWWPGTVEAGRFLDPDKYFVVCANILGSCYGTTGPTEINPATGEPWYGDFPKVTIRDMVRAHQLLAEHLGISHAKLLIGSSMGGFQCLEWSVMQPDFAENCVFIATGAQAYPWGVAFNESQRMAIENDPTFGERNASAGLCGMATAKHRFAQLSWRKGLQQDASRHHHLRFAFSAPCALISALPRRKTAPSVQRLLLLPIAASLRLAQLGAWQRLRGKGIAKYQSAHAGGEHHERLAFSACRPSSDS